MPKVIDLPIATSMDGTDYLIMEESTGGTKKITRTNAVPLNDIGGRFIHPGIVIEGGSSATVSLGIGYGAYIIIGTIGGGGGAILGMLINNDSVSSVKNLMTGATWDNAALRLSYNSNGVLTMTNNSASITRISLYGC